MADRGKVLVTGAGGFIGHHLVSYLKRQGYWVRGADLQYPQYGLIDADEFGHLDLRRWESCLQATEGVDEVYALAADMGGMGFISANHALILHNNVGSWANGIKLASELLLDQLPAQFLSGFNHQGEALGSPLLDPRLHTIGACRVHDQRD